MNREIHVRFCEGVGGRFPRATRRVIVFSNEEDAKRVWYRIAVGTYGGVTQPFRGYSASMDCSVGHWSDHEAESREFETQKRSGREALRALQPVFQRIYEHFVSGNHPYRRWVPFLDGVRSRERKDDYKIRFTLPDFARSFDGIPRSLDVVRLTAFHLYLKKGIPEIHRELALSEFLLSQASGPFRELFVGETQKHSVPNPSIEEPSQRSSPGGPGPRPRSRFPGR